MEEEEDGRSQAGDAEGQAGKQAEQEGESVCLPS